MDIKINGHNFEYDITSVSMLFFPGEKVFYTDKSHANKRAVSSLKISGGKYVSATRIFFEGRIYSSQKTVPVGSDVKNLVKQTFYTACSKATKITSPWGILTGIRPMSVYSKLADSGVDADKIMQREYYVSPSKIELLKRIYNIQNTFKADKKDISIYISIPFCPDKCSYCSFISVAAANNPALLDEYLACLKEELQLKAETVKRFGLNVRSLYIGGGTPGILSENQLSELLELCSQLFSYKDIPETCVEIGRPELVTNEKLGILKKYNTNRVCINTQTTNDSVLRKINRKHTGLQYFDAVGKAASYNFESINTDLIAGLPTESYQSFCRSVDDVVNIVDNVTIHTLALKRSSALVEDKSNFSPVSLSVDRMLEYAYNKLISCGYQPYYIYRQKNCVANGENIGFCKPEKICRYNIYMMEDIHSVLACGAGASSKIIDGQKVSRVINVKYPMEYVREFDKTVNNSEKVNSILKAVFENE